MHTCNCIQTVFSTRFVFLAQDTVWTYGRVGAIVAYDNVFERWALFQSRARYCGALKICEKNLFDLIGVSCSLMSVRAVCTTKYFIPMKDYEQDFIFPIFGTLHIIVLEKHELSLNTLDFYSRTLCHIMRQIDLWIRPFQCFVGQGVHLQDGVCTSRGIPRQRTRINDKSRIQDGFAQWGQFRRTNE